MKTWGDAQKLADSVSTANGPVSTLYRGNGWDDTARVQWSSIPFLGWCTVRWEFA